MQNLIIKGKDNPVVMQFTFDGEFAEIGLANFTRITLTIGGETYDSDTQPTLLFTNGNNELRLKVGDTTALEVGTYIAEIVGFNIIYNDGYLISGADKNLLPKIKVV
jgi:hypothetical protein